MGPLSTPPPPPYFLSSLTIKSPPFPYDSSPTQGFFSSYYMGVFPALSGSQALGFFKASKDNPIRDRRAVHKS